MRFQRVSQKHWVQKCSRLDDQVASLFVILNIFYRDNANKIKCTVKKNVWKSHVIFSFFYKLYFQFELHINYQYHEMMI